MSTVRGDRESSSVGSYLYRFGQFVLDPRRRTLSRANSPVLLTPKAFDVLVFLVRNPNRLVTKEELLQAVWGDTFVEEGNLTQYISHLRKALGDNSEDKRLIVTIARKGYQFTGDVSVVEVADIAKPSTAGVPRDEVPKPQILQSGALIGKKVSHYRVLKVIGGGGMGMVYEAEDLKLSRRVALKFLPEELASDPVALKRFEREAQTASALNHANICTIYEIEEHKGQPFIVLELLEGETLRSRLTGSEPKALPLAEVLDIAFQICDGLQAAHNKEIIHRDIKPANIFLTEQGTVKILDFGLAKLATSKEIPETELTGASPKLHSTTSTAQVPAEQNTLAIHTSLTCTGSMAGTAGYMSPEQVRKEKLDVRSDLFSFGLVLYQMAAGRRAFEDETLAALRDAILNQTPAPAHDLNSEVPRGLDVVITKALEKDRTRRYQSAAEMREALARVQREMQPSRQRLRRWFPAAALLILLATGLRSFSSYRNRVTLSANDTIVLADINNQTADPAFDDALNAALRYGMEQTPYLNVLAIDKVFGTLRMLNLPLTTKVREDVARQVCVRTNSKMVIASSVADVGNRFRIEIKALNCQSGATVARIDNDVANRNDVVHVLGVSAAQLRGKLGEPSASLARFNKPLEEATSASPEALQVGLVGYKRHVAGDFLGAIPYYQRAIELDPNFALAYVALGAANSNRRELGLAKTAITKAYELRNRMTEPSRLRAEYQYYDMVTGEQEKAYRVLVESVQTFPRDTVAHNNLARCLSRLGQPDRAVAEATEAARLLPSPWSYRILMLKNIDADRLNEARATFDEATARNFDSVDLRLERVRLAFLQNDQPAMQEKWKWAVGKADAYRFLVSEATVEGYYGRLRSAHLLLQQATDLASTLAADLATDNIYEALQEAEVGNSAHAQQIAATAFNTVSNRYSKLMLALVFARTGEIKQAQKLANALDQESPLDTLIQNYDLPMIRAAMKLHANDPAGAIEILRPVLKYDLSTDESFNGIYPAYIRGLAYLQLRDGRSAAAEFQKLLDHRGIVGRDITGALAHLQLARAQKMMSDEAAARRSYEDFLTLWKDADPDIPVYQQAKAEYSELRNRA